MQIPTKHPPSFTVTSTRYFHIDHASQILVCHSRHRGFLILLPLLLGLLLLHDLAHPALHQLLLQLPHPHVGLDRSQLRLCQLAVEFLDLSGEVALRCEFLLHVAEHLQLDGALLVLAGLVLHHHLRHVFHHVRLHLHPDLLLDLELVQIRTSLLLHHLLLKLLLQLVHLDYLGLFPQEQL